MSGKGLGRKSTPGTRHPWSAGVAASSTQTWRGLGGYITKPAVPCFILTLLVHAVCTQSFSDYDRKNLNFCVA